MTIMPPEGILKMALSGPRLEPKNGKADALVVLLHGYGADGNDLIGLAQPLSSILPSAAFVAPDAPQPCPGARFQWFAIAELDPERMHEGVLSAAPALEAFIDAELRRLSLTADRLILIGFSQGTMMALHLGLGTRRPAAIVGFSGMLTGPPKIGEAPPVFLAHGGADPLIPAEALYLTAATLGATGVRVQWHISPELGHGIDDVGLSLAGSFLALALAGRLAASGEACCALS
jgi:phospholipase/carboxylesterase